MENQSIAVRTDRSHPFCALAQRLTVWRATRQRGQRIPDELWKAAVDLARAHGLSPTSTALKLNYYDLQGRLDPAKRARPHRVNAPTFVALPALPPSSAVGQPGTLELVRPSGGRLTLRLPNASAKELLPLVGLILRQKA